MGTARPEQAAALAPLTLDAGALIGFEDRNRVVGTLVDTARKASVPIIVPVGALAQVWRGGARQARLAALVQARGVILETVTVPLAKAAGELCGRRGTNDVIDATVVLTARKYLAVIATSDPADLCHLDARLTVVQV
ncbi:MAG: hypothetical protein HYY04_09535 [Chloroflexi bacterium]|nr:hypothetical protein [Chloroflexota bacterium]